MSWWCSVDGDECLGAACLISSTIVRRDESTVRARAALRGTSAHRDLIDPDQARAPDAHASFDDNALARAPRRVERRICTFHLGRRHTGRSDQRGALVRTGRRSRLSLATTGMTRSRRFGAGAATGDTCTPSTTGSRGSRAVAPAASAALPETAEVAGGRGLSDRGRLDVDRGRDREEHAVGFRARRCSRRGCWAASSSDPGSR
jgi:hypothetical protein